MEPDITHVTQSKHTHLLIRELGSRGTGEVLREERGVSGGISQTR